MAIFSIKRSVNMQESFVEISTKNDSPETYISLAPKDAFLRSEGRVLTLPRTRSYAPKDTSPTTTSKRPNKGLRKPFYSPLETLVRHSEHLPTLEGDKRCGER